MTTQPRALALADRCANLATIADAYSEEAYRDAAAKLRRLSALNAQLLLALKHAEQSLDYVERVHGGDITGGFKRVEDINRARAAIKAAEAE